MKLLLLALISSITILLFLFFPAKVAATQIETTNWIFPNNVSFANDYTDPQNALTRDGSVATADSGAGRMTLTDFDSVDLPDGAEISKIEIRFHLAGVRTTYRFRYDNKDCKSESNPNLYKSFATTSTTNIDDYIVNYTEAGCTDINEDSIENGNYEVEFLRFSGVALYKVDDVSVRFIYSYEPLLTPTPFLDLPWDYTGKSLDEVALDPESWFDHEHPLQNVDCCTFEVLSYIGKVTNDAYRSHAGYDYSARHGLGLGSPVLAAASGSATFLPENSSGGLGNVVKIDHGNGYQTWYGHLSYEDLITSGSIPIPIEKGQMIGRVGKTGDITGPHLHFAVFKDENENGDFSDDYPFGLVDPLGWEGDYADPWEEYEENGRNGAKSYNLYINRKQPATTTLTDDGGIIQEDWVTITVPQNAYDGSLTVTLKNGPYEKKSENIKSILPSIFLTALNSIREAVTDFLEPLELKYDYSNADLSNIDEDTLSFYFYNQETGEWEKIPTSVDKNSKTAVALLPHFSQYALMGELKDLDAPVTEASINGKDVKSWYNESVNLELIGNDGTDGIGIFDTIYTINGKDWLIYSSPILFNDEGTYTVKYMSYDKAGNEEEIKTLVFNIDKTTPVIAVQTKTSDGEEYISGTWTNKDVIVTFSCEDDFSGVLGFTNPITLSSEGVNQTVDGECQDKAGNYASVEVGRINIDKTSPKALVSTSKSVLWPPNGKLVPVDISASFTDLSGIYAYSIVVTDEYDEVVIPNITNGGTIQLPAARNADDMNGRVYTVIVSAQDMATNTSINFAEVIVPHDQR